MTTLVEQGGKRVKVARAAPQAGDEVFWSVRYRTGPETWGYAVIEARVLSAGTTHALVEVVAMQEYSRSDYLRYRLHLMPLVRLCRTRAEAEDRRWTTDQPVCAECGYDHAEAGSCHETAVNTR